jgi:peptidoglycan/xylan/chitin deacetylase (PgdA/CDA1 family)
MGLVVRATLVGAAVVVAAGAGAGAHPASGSTATLVAASARTTVLSRTTVLATARTSARTTSEAPSCSTGLVALTFDDGPARGLTAELVGILEDRHVPATFFMVGSRVRTAPRIARLVARAGFTIGNHTWSHPQLTRLSDRAVRHEIRSTAHELRVTGIRPGTLMRPPYGAIDVRVRADVHDLGLVPVLWNVDSDDWKGGSARRIAASILRQLRPHRSNIVLQHDGITNSPASVAAVPLVIRAARHRGHCFAGLGPHGRVVAPDHAEQTAARADPETHETSVAPRLDLAYPLGPGSGR